MTAQAPTIEATSDGALSESAIDALAAVLLAIEEADQEGRE